MLCQSDKQDHTAITSCGSTLGLELLGPLGQSWMYTLEQLKIILVQLQMKLPWGSWWPVTLV